MSDPRVFFAAQRTLLAWIRTGITIIGLGFVVAKFGLFLAVITGAGEAHGTPLAHWHSNALGIALVLIGAGAVFGSVVNYRHFVRLLPPQDMPNVRFRSLVLLVAIPVVVIALLLALYLATS